MGKTDIGWTERSVNPLRARNVGTGKIGWWCTHKSPGCIGCYAESRNMWIGNHVRYEAGNRDRVEMFLDPKMLSEPFRIKKPAMWFVCSMTDLFGEFVPDKIIDRIYAMMAMNQQHTFQCLTKREERLRDYMKDPQTPYRVATEIGRQWATRIPIEWPLPNCWLGVSVEDQRRANERLPVLRDTPATLRMVSFEPLLEPIDVEDMLDGVHWGIIGGHSGTAAEEFHCEWGINLLGQLRRARVAAYMKQLGSKPMYHGQRILLPADDSKGENPERWPADGMMNVRDYPRPPR